jgi:hypothetical protein
LRKFASLIVFLIASVTHEARAAVLSGDLYASGDGLLTVDTASGLEWTNRTVGTEFTLGDFLNGNTPLNQLGFRLPTVGYRTSTTYPSAEMYGLLFDAGADCVVRYTTAFTACSQSRTAANAAAYTLLLNTGWLPPITYQGPFSGFLGASAMDIDFVYKTMAFFTYTADRPAQPTVVAFDRLAALALHREYGLSTIALVRTIPLPVPPAALLVSSALAALGWIRRKPE